MGIEDDDPNSHCVGESALAVCYKEKRLYVATDNHAVQAYTYPAFDKDGIVTRFTAPVTQIKSSSKIEVIICLTTQMLIHSEKVFFYTVLFYRLWDVHQRIWRLSYATWKVEHHYL